MMIDSCVVETRGMVDKLRELGVEAEPLAVRVLIVEGDTVHAYCGYTIEETVKMFGPESRPSVMRARRLSKKREAGPLYRGHLVTFLPKFNIVLDPRSKHFSMPQVGFEAPPFVRFKGDSFRVKVGRFEMHYRVRRPDDRSWKYFYDRVIGQVDEGVLLSLLT
jgi:hypothetical protein